MEALYTASVTAIGGRAGHVKSSDGVIDFDVRPPKEMGGPEGSYANPELLFAAGYAACFGGAYGHIALQKGHRIRPEITLHATLNKVSDGFQLSAVIDIKTTGIDKATADELAADAHAFCPYSKATRGNIDVTLNVIAE